MTSMINTLLRDHTFRDVHLAAILNVSRGYYVIPGQEPAISQRGAGANMSVDVGAFKFVLAGAFGEKLTTTNVVIGAADATKPRIDIIYLNSSGTIAVLAGTARAVKPTAETTWQKYEEPYPADFSSTSGIVLAEILVPAGATTIVNAYIRNVCIAKDVRLGPSQQEKTVGPYDWCDFKTDGAADEVQVNAAIAALTASRTWYEKVVVVGSLVIAAAIIPTAYTILEVNGTISKGDATSPIIYSTENNISITSATRRGGILDGNRASNTNINPPILLTGDNLTISNLQIQNSYKDGIGCDGTNNTVINYNYITDCYDNTGSSANGSGIAITGIGENCDIHHNIIRNCGMFGITMAKYSGSRITNNDIRTVYSTFGIGVAGTGTGNDMAYDILVADNYIGNTYKEAINLYRCKLVSVLGNTVHTTITDYGLSAWLCEFCLIADNTVSYAYKSGITLDSCYSCSVKCNSLYNNVDGGESANQREGILLISTYDAECKYNTVSDNYVEDIHNPRRMTYGIAEVQVSGSCNVNLIHGNQVLGYVTGAVHKIGANSVEEHTMVFSA